MRRRWTSAGCVLAFCAGVAAARIGRGAASTDAPSPPPPVSSAEVHPCPPAPAAEESAAPYARHQAVDLEIERLIGAPREMPADFEERWRPENAAAAVREALFASGLDWELGDLACEEHPCLAVLSGEGSPEEVLAALGLDPYLPTFVMGAGQTVGGETTWQLTVPLVDPPDPADTLWIRRLHHRVDRTGEDTLTFFRELE